jgi:hypothetical protein
MKTTFDDDGNLELDLQDLINDGTAWKLEGSVGRAAMECINSGICILGIQGQITEATRVAVGK